MPPPPPLWHPLWSDNSKEGNTTPSQSAGGCSGGQALSPPIIGDSQFVEILGFSTEPIFHDRSASWAPFIGAPVVIINWIYGYNLSRQIYGEFQGNHLNPVKDQVISLSLIGLACYSAKEKITVVIWRKFFANNEHSLSNKP